MEMRTKGRYAFGLVCILAGLLLEYFEVGVGSFAGYGSVGKWLLYVGFFMMIFVTVMSFWKRKRVVDERMEFVAAKAARVTFLFLVTLAFAIMIIDGIQPIEIPLHMFMSYLVSSIILVYYVSYQWLLRKY